MQSSIQVGVNGDAVWVKVEGKGSFLNSGNLKEFTREMVNRGYREFVVAVKNGRTGKQMPPWKEYLTEQQISQIGAYLETLAIEGASWK